jgi:hypothetical protein
MLKAIAVLRTIFLGFVLVYTLRAMQFWADFPRTLDEQYSLCAQTRSLLIRAAWIAIAWIALETIVGWLLAMRRPKPLPAVGAPAGEPPVAPPGRR